MANFSYDIMHLRYLLLFVVLFVTNFSITYAQLVPIDITIKSATTKMPLPYATVYSFKQRTGKYSGEDGNLLWSLNVKDTITISFLSYEAKTVLTGDLVNAKEIFLNEIAYTLDSIEIKSNKKRQKRYRVGFYDDPTEFDSWGVGVGSIAVNYIKNNTNREGFLKEVMIDFGRIKNQPHKSKARIRVFTASNPEKGPGRDVLSENIFMNIPRFSTHQKVDVSSYNIKFPLEGLFVGIEFLGFETNKGFLSDWKQQTGGRVTSTIRDDYKSVGMSWRFPDTMAKPRWMNITNGSEHKAWERILFKIGAEVETAY